jgi:hypothetical protein
MFNEDMPATFVTYAADILGETSRGLSGPQIIKITAAHAVDCDARLPHPTYPFSKIGINKRTALCENVMAFSSKERYKIIKEMCDHPTIQAQQKEEAQKLKVKLFTKYAHLDEEGGSEGINETIVEQTRHWLEPFPDALQLFNTALQKQENGVFLRNLLDDLRLALEKLLQALFNNGKSLENQLPLLGSFLKNRGGSPELTNMFQKLLDYYSKYQNSYVKHNDAVIEDEIEFIFEITASFMKHLVRLNSRDES